MATLSSVIVLPATRSFCERQLALSKSNRSDNQTIALRTSHARLAVLPAPTLVARGFTLIELAIVLFIVALMLGGMLLPLAGQQDVRNFGDTQKILAEARDALTGFAMANERLPCPASNASNGQEVFCTTDTGACTDTTSIQAHGRCAYPYNGFIPAATLGLSPVDALGYRLDGWGGETAHRLRYAVSTANSNAYTAPARMKNVGMTTLAAVASGDLKICSTGTGMANEGTATAACAANSTLAADAVAVILSPGKNAGAEGAGDHEKHNSNIPTAVVAGDPAFVSAAQGPTFDDQLLWLSKNALFNRMVAAGKLP
jgi:prepilin-type N-terminal cleavage/methylation domain-containing protein